MKGFLQVFYTIFSALMLAAGIPNALLPFGSPLAGLFALVPLYLALAECRTCGRASALTALHFSLVQLLSSYWLGYFRDFAVFTVGGPTIAYAFIGAAFGAFIHAAFAPAALFLQTSAGAFAVDSFCAKSPCAVIRRITLFAAIWTLWEYQKSIGFLAYPWGTLIMTAYRWRYVTQIVDLCGTWGISFLFSLFAAVFAEGLRLLPLEREPLAKPLRKAYCAAGFCTIILFAASLVYGICQCSTERVPQKYLDALVVQQNSDSWANDGEERTLLAAQELTERGLSEAERKPDLVCWNEAMLNYALPVSLGHYWHEPQRQPLLPFIERIGIPFVIGVPVLAGEYSEEADYFAVQNGAALFNADASVQGYYGKIHLVPFAEYIPFSEYEWVRKFMDALVGFSYGWSPGTEYKIFSVPLKNGGSIAFSVPICFEDAFPDVCRNLWRAGSEVLVNITNDSWSRTESAEYQHFVIASYRAIELRTTLVRATNSGFSVALDPTGRIIDSMPLFRSDSKCMHVPVYERRQTLYAALGDWLPLALLAAVLAYFGFACASMRKGRKF